jgi:hypothetical protein
MIEGCITSADMLSLALIRCVRDQVCGIPFAEHAECFFVPRLLDEAVASEISTRGIAVNEVLFGEESLSSRIVPRGEVNLSQPEGVIIIIYTNAESR